MSIKCSEHCVYEIDFRIAFCALCTCVKMNNASISAEMMDFFRKEPNASEKCHYIPSKMKISKIESE